MSCDLFLRCTLAPRTSRSRFARTRDHRFFSKQTMFSDFFFQSLHIELHMSIKTYILALDGFSSCFWQKMALVSQLVFEMQLSLPIMNEATFFSSEKCRHYDSFPVFTFIRCQLVFVMFKLFKVHIFWEGHKILQNILLTGTT